MKSNIVSMEANMEQLLEKVHPIFSIFTQVLRKLCFQFESKYREERSVKERNCVFIQVAYIHSAIIADNVCAM